MASGIQYEKYTRTPLRGPQGGHFLTSSEVCQYGTQMKGLATQNSTMTSVLLETTAYQFYDNKTDLKYQKEHNVIGLAV